MDTFVFSIITVSCLAALFSVSGLVAAHRSRRRHAAYRPGREAALTRRPTRPETPEDWAAVDRHIIETIALLHYEGTVLEWQEARRVGQLSLDALYNPPFPERKRLHPQLPAASTVPDVPRLTRPLTLEDIVQADRLRERARR